MEDCSSMERDVSNDITETIMAPVKERIKLHLATQFHLPEDQIDLMLPNFIATLGSHLENLRKALSEEDPVAIGKSGHTIKGAFLNLGLTECAEVALTIERMGKAGDTNADYRTLVNSLAEKLEPVFLENSPN